jgi:hypothetical protein
MLEELVAARDARSAERVARLLADDVRYWDCVRGELSGREAVAAALTAGGAELETIAVGGDDAVLELRVDGRRSTEVYRLAGGAVASIRAYVDPAHLHRDLAS